MTGGKSNRQRGDYFERQAVDALRAAGYGVIRSAGSLGVADLWAALDGDLLLVSCKLSGRIDPAERLDLLDLARITKGRPIVAMRPTAGKVQLSVLVTGFIRPVHWLILPVPPRKDTRVGRPSRPRPVPEAPVRDSLEPAGVQLTLPTT